MIVGYIHERQISIIYLEEQQKNVIHVLPKFCEFSDGCKKSHNYY